MALNTTQLEKALWEMPIETLLTEIPEIQNSMIHLIQSNTEMEDFDPKGQDEELTLAIEENKQLLLRQDKRIDLTLQVIRERVNEAAEREMASTVATFRARYINEPIPPAATEEQGVYL